MDKKVTFKDNIFYIKGQECFLFGGEVHYFRLPKSEWEDRILKVKAAGGNLISTYIPWIIHEDIEGDIDVTGKRRPENDLGYFLKIIKKNNMYCMIRPGPYIMSEIVNEGLPGWIYDKFDDIVALDKYGNKHPSRCVYLLHKGFLELVDRWYKALGSVIRPYMIENGGPVVIAQLDNEIGMMHWCSGMADYSLQNIKDFNVYLHEKYGSALQDEYKGVDFGEGFYDFACNPPASLANKVRVDLSLYMREYFKRYFAALKEKFNKYMGQVPVVVNVHGFDSVDIIKRGMRYPIGVSQLSRVCDIEDTVMAGDYYIGNIFYDNFQDIMLANAFTYAVQREGQPLFSAEFQGGFQVDTPRMQPTTYDLTTRLCVANGMNSLNYYMFAGGTNVKGTGLLGMRHSWQAPVDTDGSLKPHYKVIAHLADIINAAGKSLLHTRQESVVHLGIIPEYFMTEYKDENSKDICDELVMYRENLLYEGMGKGMSIMNIVYEGYNLTKDKRIDISKVPKLAVFSTRYMDKEIQQKLINYVKDGGKLLIFPTLPVMDLQGRPCTILLKELNCKAEVKEGGFAKYIDDVENLIIFNATNFGDVENVFAKYEKDDMNIGFTKEMGKGKIVVFGVGMAHDYYYRDQVVLNLFKKIDVEPLFRTDNICDKLSLISRVNSDGGRYLFIDNFDEYDKKTRFYMRDKPLFDGKEMVIKSRKGLMLPLNMKMDDDIFVKYSTAEISSIEKTGDGTVKVRLSLSQPEDEMVLRTNMKVRKDKSYTVAAIGDNYYKIVSNKHGYINDNIILQLTK